MTSVAVVVPCLDEGRRVAGLVQAMPPLVTSVIVVDDGSADDTSGRAREAGAIVLRHPSRQGVGAALRHGYRHALGLGADVVVTMAGNGKDDPGQVPRLVEPITAGMADVVQGSRWLGQPRLGDMPRYRVMATRLHPLLVTASTGRFTTESTSGFRALHRRVLEDRRLLLDTPGLDGYQLEPWLYLRALRLGYRALEVPVEKVYPPRAQGPATRMTPVVSWLQMLSPLVRSALAGRRVSASSRSPWA